MKLILHGTLREKYGESIDFQSPTVFDALEGFSRQMPDFPRDLIEVVGFETEEKLRAPTTETEVHLVPAMFGGSAIGKILAGIALIAVVVVTGGLGAAPLLGTALSGALLGTGIGLVLGGVMQLFMKAPTISKDADPEASKYLGNGKNTSAIGTPITMAWGRVKLYGQYLSIQVNSNQMAFGIFPDNPT